LEIEHRTILGEDEIGVEDRVALDVASPEVR